MLLILFTTANTILKIWVMALIAVMEEEEGRGGAIFTHESMMEEAVVLRSPLLRILILILLCSSPFLSLPSKTPPVFLLCPPNCPCSLLQTGKWSKKSLPPIKVER